MTTTATRAQLQQYFATNCIPTQSNFSDLINGMLNQADDGIVKSAGNPLSIGAAGDATTAQKVLNLYANLSDQKPAWTLQLNPRSNQNDPTTAHSGFSISDANGTSRLFIDASSYNVGIGTNTPKALLDINGGANVGAGLTVGTTLTVGAGLTVSGSQVLIGQDSTPSSKSNIQTNGVICFAQATGDELNAGKIIYKPYWCNNALTIVGAGASTGSRAIALWDNVSINNTLTITGAATLNNNLTVSGSSSLAALTVSGAAALNNSLAVTGMTTLAALTVSGAATLNSNLMVTGASTLVNLTAANISSPMWKVTSVFNNKAAPGAGLPLSGTFTSHGGTLLIFVSGSGRYGSGDYIPTTTGDGLISVEVDLDTVAIGYLEVYSNLNASHMSFIPNLIVKTGAASGSHTIKLSNSATSTITDGNDYFTVVVVEFPF